MAKKYISPVWYHGVWGSRLRLSLAALAGLLIGTAAATDALDKLAVFVGAKPNALQLSRDDERARFSRELTRAAWNRLFWMRRYVTAVKNKYSEPEQQKEWDAYSITLAEWNRDLMVNILSLEQHYGNAKRKEFEQSIQPAFGKLHYCMEAIKHPTSKLQCALSESRELSVIETGIDRLNSQLYCFVSGLPNKDKQCR